MIRVFANDSLKPNGVVPALFFGIIFVIIALIILYVVLSIRKAKKENKTNWIMRLWSKSGTKTVASSVIAILCGLIFGSILLICFIGSSSENGKVTFFDAIDGIQLIFAGPFSTGIRNDYGSILFGFNGSTIGNMLFNAIPLILVGLSVAIAFKTGLFNIGTPGQWAMGCAFTYIVALIVPTKYNLSWYQEGFMGFTGTPSVLFPTWIVWIMAFIAGGLAGALWGAIPGLFKSLLNINEVITCIMTNWISVNIVTALFDKTTGPFRELLDPSGTKNQAFLYKTTFNGVETWKMGLDKIFPGSQINGGIIIAIVIAIIMFIIIDKTKFGYELKACGSNRHASTYAGINAKRSIFLSMVIAGALAGMGAALYYLSGNTEFKWETYQTLNSTAFNGIPVALLASNSPIGVIFTSIFMGYLNIAGLQIKNLTSYNEYITSIISAIIVYFSAFSLVIKNLLQGDYKNFFKKKKEYELSEKEEEVNDDKTSLIKEKSPGDNENKKDLEVKE